MKDFLLSERARRRGELDAMEQRRPILLAEIAVLDTVIAQWEMAQKASVSADTPIPVSSADVPGGSPRTGTMPPPKRRAPKGTGLSPRWRCVMAEAIRRFPAPMSHDDVPIVQKAAHQEPASREQIRSHVWTFAKDGLYRKLGSGSFVATEKAATALGLALGAGAQATAGNTTKTEAPDSGELSSAPKTNGALPLNLY